jgi:hypothetical protein
MTKSRVIEQRYFDNRFYAVFWRAGVGQRGGGWWNYSVTDGVTGKGLAGTEPGLTKAAFKRAQAIVIRWAMIQHNVKRSGRGGLERVG